MIESHLTEKTVGGGSGGRFRKAYAIAEEAIASKAFPGCAFGVWADGRVQLQDALGRFTYEPKATSVAAGTLFDIASLTKVLATTTMAMLLAQRQQLQLDTQVGTLVPGFIAGREPGDPARRVTLRHLLAHNSGLPGYVEFFRTATTPESLLSACFQLKLEAEPESRAEYSDPGFILLGKALEAYTGEPLDSWCQREIFQPLALRATVFRPNPELRPMIPPTQEDTTFRKRRIQGEVQDENAWVLGGVAGHAGLFSNVPDVLRFARAILDAGKRADNLLKQDTLHLFSERQLPSGSSRALGWDTRSQNSSSGHHFSAHTIGHLAYSGCSLWIDLESAVAIVLLTNRTWPDRACQLIRQVRPAFHDALREAL
jgi:CubicO group peptidase (beta-lactamase class C family)